MVAMSIDNNEIWQSYVKNGTVKGLSLEGLFKDKLIKQSAVEPEEEEEVEVVPLAV